MRVSGRRRFRKKVPRSLPVFRAPRARASAARRRWRRFGDALATLWRRFCALAMLWRCCGYALAVGVALARLCPCLGGALAFERHSDTLPRALKLFMLQLVAPLSDTVPHFVKILNIDALPVHLLRLVIPIRGLRVCDFWLILPRPLNPFEPVPSAPANGRL